MCGQAYANGLRRAQPCAACHIDLDAVFRAGQTRAVDGGPGRGVAGHHPLLPSPVHLGKGRHIAEPDSGRQHAAFIAAAERQQTVNAGQRLPGLGVDVGAAAIVGHLAGQVHGVLVDDGLG